MMMLEGVLAAAPAPPLRVTVNSSVRSPALQHLPHHHRLHDHDHLHHANGVGNDDFLIIVIKIILIIIIIIIISTTERCS